jgi:hypothetical protein
MHLENPYTTLSPQAYAALIDGIRLQAERERRAARRSLGLLAFTRLRPWWKKSGPISPPSPSSARHAAAARYTRSAVPCP